MKINIMLGIMLVALLSIANAQTSSEIARVKRAEFQALCSFYIVALPGELLDIVNLPSCKEYIPNVSLSAMKAESDSLWTAVDSLGEERAKELRAQYAKFVEAIPVLTSADIRKMSARELCMAYEEDSQNEADVMRELRRRGAFSEKTLKAIANKHIFIGMPEDAVYCSLGKPETTNRTVGSWGVDKQLVFYGTYVYTRNGVVTSWQD